MRRWLALVLILLLAVPRVAGQGQPLALLYFPETGFAIINPRFVDYFQRRGGVGTFGYPISRELVLLGLPSQIFQRAVFQLAPDGSVRLLNLLEEDLLPPTRLGGATVPPPDSAMVADAPRPDQPDYAARVAAFVARYVPERWGGLPVRFHTTYLATVPLADAIVAPGEDGVVRTLLGLEVWGLPTSPPARDPADPGVVYQRFQRGVMRYDQRCDCTVPLALGTTLKALLLGRWLPSDLTEESRGSRLLAQYDNSLPNGVARPAALPATTLLFAFQPLAAPTLADDLRLGPGYFAGAASDPATARIGYHRDGYLIHLRVGGSPHRGTGYYAALTTREVADFAAEVDVRLPQPVASGAAGISFRRQSPERSYLFLVDPFAGSFTLRKRWGGNVMNLVDWQRSPAIQRGTSWNHLRVEASGPRITLAINGEVVASLVDSSLARGAIGLEAAAFGQPLTARFTNFYLWAWDSPPRPGQGAQARP